MERQRFLIQVLPPRKNAGGDAAMVRWRDHAQIVRFAGFQHRVPQIFGMHGGILEVDFVALLAGKAGLRDDHVMAAHLTRQEPVVRHVADSLAEQIDHQRLGLRPLDLNRRHVDLGNADIELQADVDAAQPQLEIAIRQREPELVLGDAQQHRIIQYAAGLVAENHVLGMHRRNELGVAGDDVVHEPLGIRPLDLDLPLHGDVPQGNVVHQRVVFHHRAAVLGTHVAARVVDAVVDRRSPAAGLHGKVPVRRLAHPRRNQHFHRGRTGLTQVDRHFAIRLIDAQGLTQLRIVDGGFCHGKPPTSRFWFRPRLLLDRSVSE